MSIVEGKATYYIANEYKYLKEWELKINNDIPRLNEINEYFIHSSFTGESEFSVVNNAVLYSSNEWVTMQNKSNVNEKIGPSVYFNKEDESLLQTPIYSKDLIMLIRQNSNNKKYEILVMPEFKKSSMPLTSVGIYSRDIKEFYFYSKSMDEEFVVNLREGMGDPFCFILEFYRKNGELVYTKKHEVQNIWKCFEYVDDPDYDSSTIKISPNGRFLYYVTGKANLDNTPNNNQYSQNCTMNTLMHSYFRHNRNESSNDNLTAHVYEIVLVRKNKWEDRLRKRIEEDKIQFDIKKVRTFKNFETHFGKKYHPILTDDTTFAYYNPDENWLHFETKKYTDCHVDKKLGYNINSQPFKISDYKWKVLKTGFLGYKYDMMYYLNLHVTLSKKKGEDREGEEIDVQVNSPKIIPINLMLEEGDLKIDKVYGCIDPSKVVFNLRSSVEESIYMVWSLETNIEVSNFSAKNTCYFTNGSGSQTGYIFCEDNYYVNLDVGIPNYFFGSQINFESDFINDFKISKNESQMLYDGMNVTHFIKSY